MLNKIIKARLARKNAKPAFPFNITYSVTGRCNSRCRTCNIWKSKAPDLDLRQWKSIIDQFGTAPEWVTISGGEPFERRDLPEIVNYISKVNRPMVMTIPSNCQVDSMIDDINRFRFRGRIIINLSLDGVGDKHDSIRFKGSFEKLIRTYHELKRQKKASIGLHTVISKYNVDDFKEILSLVKKLAPDSYICQIAENRVELGNMDEDILPRLRQYIKCIDMTKDIKTRPASVITSMLRNQYYKTSVEHMKGRMRNRCYAGIASAHVNYNGDLWACCVRCETMGNLLKDKLDEILYGDKARSIRKRIKQEGCICTMANATYSNVMCEPLCIFS